MSHQHERDLSATPTPQPPTAPPGELRDDPLNGRVAAIASGRAARPEAFLHEAVPLRGPAGCPFCPGNERMTPPELWADRDPGSNPDGPGWRVRVVPNLFPAFAGAPSPTHAGAAVAAEPGPSVGLYRAEPSHGVHEVIIHSPDHRASLAELPEGEVARVLATYRRRLAALRDGGYGSVVVIVNQGKAAGASLEHAHSQVMATVRRGDLIQAEVERLRAGACAACAMLEVERANDRRIIEDKDGLLTLCPWASALPYEALVLPERHQARFEEGGGDQDHALAGALGRLLRRLHGALGAGVPYNLVLHSAPPGVADFHWHLHLYPRLTTYGGFELASGIVINVVDPDQAAAAYRGVSGP